MSKNQLNKQYCTYLTHYIGDLLPEWYIGSTLIKKIENGYNGSVSSKKYKTIWNSERKNNPHLFKTRVLRRFYRRKIALIHELKIQKLHQVVKNDKYINMSYASKNGFFGMPMKGRIQLESSTNKMLETRNKEYINYDGQLTTSYKQMGSKVSKSLKEIINYNGIDTTKSQRRSIISAKTMAEKVLTNTGEYLSIREIASLKAKDTLRKKGRFFNVYHINGALIYKNIANIDLKEMSYSLVNSSRDHYLGSNNNSISRLINNNKSYLIGLYVIEIFKV